MKFRLFIQLVVCAWCMQAVSAHAAAVRENDDGRVVYSAGWADNNLSQGYHGGDQHYSSTSQATAEFSFTGTSIKWIGPKNVDCGISQVFLDNQLVASVDMYASSWLKQQVLFSRGSLENRTHTIRIVVTASKNPASIGYYSSIDAFEWDAAAGYNELNDGGLSYSGTWNVVVSPGGVANDLRTTTAAGATAQYSFTGRAIRWLGTKGNDQGIADLYVDGTRVASVDLYAPTNLVRQVLFAETNLVYGAHTLKIVATGQRNASSSGVRVTVDAVDADKTTIRVDDSSSAITRSTGWSFVTGSPAYFGGTAHGSPGVNATTSFSFVGMSVRWIGPSAPDLGSAEVYVDDVYQATISAKGPSTNEAVLFRRDFSSVGSHTITLKSISDTPFYVDAFEYDTHPPDRVPVRVNDDASGILHSSDWVSYSDSSLFQGNAHAAAGPASNGNYLEYRFTGAAVRWMGATHDLGAADVYVDGVLDGTVNQYWFPLTYRAINYQKRWDVPGTHTIKIVAASPMLASVVDALEIEQAVPADSWLLNTDDTYMALRVAHGTVYLEELKSPIRNWNWAQVPKPIFFPPKLAGQEVTWVYQGASVDSSNGTKVVLRFTSGNPNYELRATFWARPGPGPVEIGVALQNLNAGTVNVAQAELGSGDLWMTSDMPAQLYRFRKLTDSRICDAAPLEVNRITANASFDWVTRDLINQCDFIPFNVLGVERGSSGIDHGLYFGNEWSYGRFLDSAAADPLSIRHRTQLWNTSQIGVDAGATISIPTFYVGAFVGDVDDAGNRMKRWFWNHKIPNTLRANANEPLLEFIQYDKADLFAQLYDYFPLHEWGGELAKLDLISVLRETGNPFGHDVAHWLPRTDYWPDVSSPNDGLTAAWTMAREHSHKLAVYLPHAYEHPDPLHAIQHPSPDTDLVLVTQAQREAQLQALQSRFDAGWFDYWRSDFMLVTPENHASYTGFLWVLDEMMKNEDFRYEHCASAGTLKDFASLQRITFMTTEDSSTPDAHRKTMYSSTYMINPVQLKADVLLSLGEYAGALYPDAPLPSWMIKPTAASVNDSAWNRYALRTGFLGANMVTGPGISGVAGYFSPTGAEEVRVHWPLYRNKQRPILRGADVYHILPPPDGTHWDGVEYFNPKLNQGSVLLFRPGTAAAAGFTVSIKLKRLVRGATYTLSFQDDPSQNTTKTGAELMDSGITVGSSVGGNFASEIIWIN